MKRIIIRSLITILLRIILFFGLPFLFVGNILQQDIRDSNKREEEFLKWRLSKDPNLAERYYKWKRGELKLSTVGGYRKEVNIK